MALLTTEELFHFENLIYLPIIFTVLERDRVIFESGTFKLKKPYLDIIDKSLKIAESELKATNIYCKQNKLKVIKGGNDGTFTEYTFIRNGYEDQRRYLNVRLRNRTEELMGIYFDMIGN